MINWGLDDELWRHPGSLTAACCIDGTTNEGNNEDGLGGCWMGGTIGTSAPLYTYLIIGTIFHVSP